MKKFAALFIAFIFTSVASAIPLRFEEGKHYEVISNVSTPEPTLTEYFSFYCPHCFRFEPLAKSLKASLPKNAKFVKSHVDFMRNASKETQGALSRAMIVGEKMKMGDKVTEAIFEHIHVKRESFNSEEDVTKFMATLGGDTKKLQKLLNSSGAKRAAGKMKTMQEKLSAQNVLTSVPMFIVNGKYKINSRELRSEQEYKDLVAYLIALK